MHTCKGSGTAHAGQALYPRRVGMAPDDEQLLDELPAKGVAVGQVLVGVSQIWTACCTRVLQI